MKRTNPVLSKNPITKLTNLDLTHYSKHLIKTLTVSLLFIVISGCQTVGKTLNLDTDLLLTFDVKFDVNPDESNRPSPVFVRFYELKSNEAFEKADFIELYERDKDILGGELVAKKELKRFAPGEKREEAFVLDPDTRYIAVFSEFYRYSESQNRLVVPVETNNVFKDKVVIELSSNTMRVKYKN